MYIRHLSAVVEELVFSYRKDLFLTPPPPLLTLIPPTSFMEISGRYILRNIAIMCINKEKRRVLKLKEINCIGTSLSRPEMGLPEDWSRVEG